MFVGLKESFEVKFNDSMWAELCLNLWFESDLVFLWYYWVRIVLKATAEKQSFKQSFPNINLKMCHWKTVQESIAKLWIVISNQMIKYQLLPTFSSQSKT